MIFYQYYDEPSHLLRKIFIFGLEAGATVHNASWGKCCINPDSKCGDKPGPCASSFTHEPAYTVADIVIDNFSYENDEFLFFHAAGNDGKVKNTKYDGKIGYKTISDMGIAKNSITGKDVVPLHICKSPVQII